MTKLASQACRTSYRSAIELFELSLRNMIQHRLHAAYGPNWFDTAVPASVKGVCQKYYDIKAADPFRTKPLGSLFDYASMGNLRAIISDKWSQFGELIDKNRALTYLLEIKDCRDELSHVKPVSIDTLLLVKQRLEQLGKLIPPRYHATPDLLNTFDHLSIEEGDGKVLFDNLPNPSYDQFVGNGRLNKAKEVQAAIEDEEQTYRILLDGQGGVGKTALATFVAHNIKHRILNGETEYEASFIVFVSARDASLTAMGIERIDPQLKVLEDLFQSVCEVTGNTEQFVACSTFEDKKNLVYSIFKSSKGLVIIDNLETFEDERLLPFISNMKGQTKLLITSRHRTHSDVSLAHYGFRVFDVLPMAEDDGRDLIRAWAKKLDLDHIVRMEDEQLNRVVKAAGGIPQVVINTVIAMHNGESLPDLVAELENLNVDSDIVEFSFRRSFESLGNDQRGQNAKKILMALSLFGDVPQLREVIGEVAGVKGQEQVESLKALFNRFLIYRGPSDINAETYFVQSMARSYALKRLKAEPLLDAELNDRYRDTLVDGGQIDRIVADVKAEGWRFRNHTEKVAALYASDATRIWKTTSDYQRAERKCKLANRLAPNLAYVYLQWARVAEWANKRSIAKDLYLKACECEETDRHHIVRIWWQRGMFELQSQAWEDARASFQKGLDDGDADNPRCWHGLGRTEYMLALKLDDSSRRPLLVKAEQYLKRGFIQYPRTKAERKHNASNWFFLCEVGLHLRTSHTDLERLLEGCNKGLELDTGNFRLLTLRQRIVKRMGREDSASMQGSWESIITRYTPGKTVIGRIYKILAQGALIELEPSVFGLLHVDRISNRGSRNPNDLFHLGRIVSVVVDQVDPRAQRITLSKTLIS